jgi:hypothetical protein
MDQFAAARVDPDPDAVEFIRFCYRRRRVGWPELYDEMCAVAGRGLYRGYSADDLATVGVGFSLFDMPALAALANTIVAEEVARRRPVSVVITPVVDGAPAVVDGTPEDVRIFEAPDEPGMAPSARTGAVADDLAGPSDGDTPAPATRRFAPVPAGA